jgi:hypothetical protein
MKPSTKNKGEKEREKGRVIKKSDKKKEKGNKN